MRRVHEGKSRYLFVPYVVAVLSRVCTSAEIGNSTSPCHPTLRATTSLSAPPILLTPYSLPPRRRQIKQDCRRKGSTPVGGVETKWVPRASPSLVTRSHCPGAPPPLTTGSPRASTHPSPSAQVHDAPTDVSRRARNTDALQADRGCVLPRGPDL